MVAGHGPDKALRRVPRRSRRSAAAAVAAAAVAVRCVATVCGPGHDDHVRDRVVVPMGAAEVRRGRWNSRRPVAGQRDRGGVREASAAASARRRVFALCRLAVQLSDFYFHLFFFWFFRFSTHALYHF